MADGSDDVTTTGVAAFVRDATRVAAADGGVDERLVDGLDDAPGGFVVTMSNGQAFAVTVREVGR